MFLKQAFFLLLFAATTLDMGATEQASAETLKKGDVVLEWRLLEGMKEKVLCGFYEVYENRETMTGRKIKLNMVIAPALGANPQPDPIFLFTGGPGVGAAADARWAIESLKAYRQNRDLVFIDQRGTGKSNGLWCRLLGPENSVQTYLGDMFEPAYVKNCLAELEKNADLRMYATTIAMADIDEARAALGYDKINISGGSYGGRAVLEYMRRHGETVRTAAIFTPSPTYHAMPSRFAQDAQRSLDLLVEDCAADEACNKKFPDFAADLNKVIAELKAKPARVKVHNPFTKDQEEVTFAYGPFTTGLRSLLYSAQGSSIIPMLIAEAAKGNFEPITLYTAFYAKDINSFIAEGMYLSVTCAEDIPYFDKAAMAEAAKDTFLGDYRIRVQTEACRIWPRGVIADDYRDPVKSNIPALIVSGETDPVTPPYWSVQIAKHLSNGLHISVPNASHDANNHEACLEPILLKFIEQGSTKDLDVSCVAEIKRPPFMTDLAAFMERLQSQ